MGPGVRIKPKIESISSLCLPPYQVSSIKYQVSSIKYMFACCLQDHHQVGKAIPPSLYIFERKNSLKLSPKSQNKSHLESQHCLDQKGGTWTAMKEFETQSK